MAPAIHQAARFRCAPAGHIPERLAGQLAINYMTRNLAMLARSVRRSGVARHECMEEEHLELAMPATNEEGTCGGTMEYSKRAIPEAKTRGDGGGAGAAPLDALGDAQIQSRVA